MKKARAWLEKEWQRQGYTFSIGVGFCLGIGFIVPLLWWFSLVGIVVIVHGATQPMRVRSFVTAVMFAWWVKYLCALLWYTTVYPIEWISGLSSGVQLLAIVVYWFSSALWLSVGGGVGAFVLATLYRSPYIPRFLWYLLVPFIWLGSELFGAFFFSVVTLGPGSFIQTYFSFGMSGYLLAETTVGIVLAGICGVWGLSFCIAVLGVVLFAACERGPRTFLPVIGSGLLLFVCVAYLPVSSASRPKQDVTLISVDTNFPDDSVTTMSGIAKRMLILNAAVSAAVAAHPTYILLPEDSRYLDSVYGGATASSLLGQFMFTHGTTTSVLIDSYRAETREGQAYVRAIMLDAVHKQVYQFDKQYLVPQGEYVPYVYAGVLRAFGFGALVDGIEKDSAYVPGPLTRKVVSVPKNIPAVLFCSESVRPDGVTALLRDANAPFVVHPMSHGWFHHPTELWHELDQMLRIHARVAGVPIVSAGNKVDGKLYLPNGQIDSGVVVGSGDGWVLRKFTF